MNKVVIAHGKPPKDRYVNPAMPKPHVANWFPWAKEQLESKGIPTAIPALPKPYHPVYQDWREVFMRQRIDENTALVGFSAGAEFLLRLLSEEERLTVEKVVIVAPWQDVENKYGDFSSYNLNPQIRDRVGRLTIISSIDDSDRIQSNACNLAEAMPWAKSLQLNGYGHFMLGNNMTNVEFPELIAELMDA